ncbi:hypothetical protein RhiirC2_744227 [Rhizophagus irregularis]|uniref:Uncharacterized protein n=1 Tax=Rhizophagus irregularis TaxID=588596 RepID=A0A2N1NCS0_9GLOM|nr:hypothetical protein RhiirC2_744227 [Rhizophagus irregularis]
MMLNLTVNRYLQQELELNLDFYFLHSHLHIKHFPVVYTIENLRSDRFSRIPYSPF